MIKNKWVEFFQIDFYYFKPWTYQSPLVLKRISECLHSISFMFCSVSWHFWNQRHVQSLFAQSLKILKQKIMDQLKSSNEIQIRQKGQNVTKLWNSQAKLVLSFQPRLKKVSLNEILSLLILTQRFCFFNYSSSSKWTGHRIAGAIVTGSQTTWATVRGTEQDMICFEVHQDINIFCSLLLFCCR